MILVRLQDIGFRHNRWTETWVAVKICVEGQVLDQFPCVTFGINLYLSIQIKRSCFFQSSTSNIATMRVLCLHGMGVNAAIFQAQTGLRESIVLYIVFSTDQCNSSLSIAASGL